jgi:dihydrofolate reductase
MRKVILSMMLSLDGFIEGPSRELDWHVWDEEMEKYMYGDVLNKADAILLGRVAYQLLADYWPSAADSIAPKMNNLPKIVFSKTLEKVEWNNSRLVKENIADEVSKMKQQPGKDLVLFAGADIASTFIQLGLIDEYQIIVNPVILGSGKPLFKGIKDKLNLKLLKIKTFSCGNIILYYQPVKIKEIAKPV